MLFNSLHFLLFFPVAIMLYYLLPHRYRWVFILVASCYFYMAFVPEYILILFVLIIIDYVSGIKIEAAPKEKKKKYLIYSLLSNIGLLVFFKFNYTININLAYLLKSMGIIDYIYVTKILLPLGLSFHTFQSMSYTIEVYRGNQKAEKHLGYFASYVLFFPQMVAGPIERYASLGMQLQAPQKLQYDNIARGFRLMLYGFFVKMVIADNLAPLVNTIYADPGAYASSSILIGILLFSFQIYADFYGYSLIAVGCARMMGIALMHNFRTPYLASSISEFWQRWHISLSSWFRDYLYIPLGGNKLTKWRFASAILLVFMLSGLWHGSTANFLIWGAMHGLFYLVEYSTKKYFPTKNATISSPLKIIRQLKTFLLVSFCWIFFRSDSFDKTKQLFTSFVNNASKTDNFSMSAAAIVLLLLFIVFDSRLQQQPIDEWLGARHFAVRWMTYATLLFCIFTLGGIQYYPFIYFQF